MRDRQDEGGDWPHRKVEEKEAHPKLQEFAERYSSMRGEPDSDMRDEMFSLFRPKIEKTPKDGSKVLALLKAIKRWEDKSGYGPWEPFCGLPTWPRPFQYTCILGACEELSQRGVQFNAKVLTFLTPYLGDALMAVSLEGWFLPQYRVLGIGEFARRMAAGIVDPILVADKKKAESFSARVKKARKEGRHGKKRKHTLP